MVTATLPCLTDDGDSLTSDDDDGTNNNKQAARISRQSIAFSVESEATITPERYNRLASAQAQSATRTKASALSGYVGLATGCGALVALSVFLPLPTHFASRDGVTPAQAVEYSFYVVGAIAFAVAVFVAFGLRGLNGEQGKGWRVLLGLGDAAASNNNDDIGRRRRSRAQSGGSLLSRSGRGGNGNASSQDEVIPYLHLMRDAVLLGLADSRIALGYVGGFVARASTVAISLFIPLFVNTFFIGNGFCTGSPHDPSPELKEECRAAYVLSSILTGVAQLAALLCAPVFGYLTRRKGTVNWPVVVSAVLGMVGYLIFPRLASPELSDKDGRGGSPAILLVVVLVGISQIGAIVCSLGSLSQGVLTVEVPSDAAGAAGDAAFGPGAAGEASIAPGEDESTETDPLIRIVPSHNRRIARTRLKGSIAGVYSLCGGAAILLLTKLGGYLFDRVSTGAPFYMMALFNGVLLVVTLLLDASRAYARGARD